MLICKSGDLPAAGTETYVVSKSRGIGCTDRDQFSTLSQYDLLNFSQRSFLI